MKAYSIYVHYILYLYLNLLGAYHLCNHPKVALDIAIKQEGVGRFLGSTAGIMKAFVRRFFSIF